MVGIGHDQVTLRKGTTVKKKVAVVSVAEAEEAARLADLPLEATVALADVAGAIKDGLLAFASATGLVVMRQMMEAELTKAIGEKHAKVAAQERVGNWHGNAKGSVVLGGRQVSTERPRGRSTNGTEIGLDTWKAFSSADLLNSLVVERMLAGVATRRHTDVAEPVGAELEERSKSMSKSAVSRRFVAATTKAMGELMARNLAELDVAVLMIDGLDMAGSCAVVALVITTDGSKVPVGLWLGDTENKTVVTALLADLVARGLDVSSGVLCVIDGAKALAAGIKKVFGDNAVVQRCVLHKRRNVEGRSWPRSSTSDWPSSSPSPMRPRGSPPPRSSPKSSRPTIPMRLHPCAKDSRTCSPCDVWASGAPWPPRSPPPIASSR